MSSIDSKDADKRPLALWPNIVPKAITHPIIVAIDQGTTSTRVIKYELLGIQYQERDGAKKDLRAIKSAQYAHKQIHPKPGWVEHDPEEIIENIKKCYKEVGGWDYCQVVGITNQRETIVAWD